MIPRFVEILRRAVRLRDSWLVAAVLVVLAVLLAWRFMGADGALHEDALSWAISEEEKRGFHQGQKGAGRLSPTGRIYDGICPLSCGRSTVS